MSETDRSTCAISGSIIMTNINSFVVCLDSDGK